MFRRLLKQGVLAGMAGGAALALVLRLIGEGPIGRAVALEGAGGDEMFGRGTQQLGGMVAAVLYGAALGAVFTVAYAAVRHRLRTTDDWRAAVALAAAGFAGVFLLPFLKYPANPPAVGDPDTIGRRTALYLLAVAWSLVATWGGWRAWRALVARGVPVPPGRARHAGRLGRRWPRSAWSPSPPTPTPWTRRPPSSGSSGWPPWPERPPSGQWWGWCSAGCASATGPEVVVAGVDVHDRA